jgi:hypothetical protein
VNLTDADNTVEIIQALAETHSGFTYSLLTMFTAVPFILTYQRRQDVNDGLIVGGFTGFVFSGLLWAAGVMAWDIAVIPLPLLVFGFGLKYFTS